MRTPPEQTPITAEMAAESSRILDEPWVDGDTTYWLEGQADGRMAVMQRRAGVTTDLAPGISARTSAHSYGGGAILVDRGRVIVTSFATHELLMLESGRRRTLVPASDAWYSDGTIDQTRDRLVCLRETTTESIVAVPLAGDAAPRTLVEGHDFFAAPRVSPDGTQLSFISWDLPHMPWTASDLWVAPIGADGGVGTPVHVAGGAHESIYDAQWSPGGELVFASDRTGYWNLYRWEHGTTAPLWVGDAEIGDAMWTLDSPLFGFASSSQLVAAVNERGDSRLVTIDLATGKATTFPTPYTVIDSVRAGAGHAIFIGSSMREATSIVDVALATGATNVLARAMSWKPDEAWIPRVEQITYPTDGRAGYAYYYPPTNPSVTRHGPAPLLVNVHGGPTSRANAKLDPAVLYWTSRGFAYLDLNYAGSTGYGRAYRERLDGRWGVVDVDDAIAAAHALVARGLADPKRLVIRGRSSGGYSVLAALAFHDVFSAGASWYGIGDLEGLQRSLEEGDKLESGYLGELIAPYPNKLYRERSPLYAADRIKAPVIFFQGSDDPIVPPAQSRAMHAALEKRGIATEYLEFPGESHGFRVPANIAKALRAELAFYGRVLGLE